MYVLTYFLKILNLNLNLINIHRFNFILKFNLITLICLKLLFIII